MNLVNSMRKRRVFTQASVRIIKDFADTRGSLRTVGNFSSIRAVNQTREHRQWIEAR